MGRCVSNLGTSPEDFRSHMVYTYVMDIPNKICANTECSNIFYKQPSDSKKYWVVKRFCSIQCSGTTYKLGVKRTEEEKKHLSVINSGKNNHFWKDGRSLSTQGYIEIWTPSGRALEHRHVMENHLGRKLTTKEHVHHLNGDKTDNRIENLRLIGIREHGHIHSMQRWHGTAVDTI